ATLWLLVRAQRRDHAGPPRAQEDRTPPQPPATRADLDAALAPFRAEMAQALATYAQNRAPSGGPVKAGPVKADPVKAGPVKADPAQVEPAGPAQAAPVDAGPTMPSAQIAEAAKRAALTTGQQMEWRAHLCHLLDWPFGALPATRHWAASPDLLVHLATQILDRQPKVVVECGSGLSTLVSARALQLTGGGALHSLEANASFAEVTRARLARLGLGPNVTIHHAPIEPLDEPLGRGWYALTALEALPERIDFLFVDGPQVVGGAARAPAIAQLFPRLAPGGAALFDDAARKDGEAMRKEVRRSFRGWRWQRLPAEKGALLFERPTKAGG
ncbi:MAG: class I SAM-dependent methyltransferase, partial [Pseudomonadota bacterium]